MVAATIYIQHYNKHYHRPNLRKALPNTISSRITENFLSCRGSKSLSTSSKPTVEWLGFSLSVSRSLSRIFDSNCSFSGKSGSRSAILRATSDVPPRHPFHSIFAPQSLRLITCGLLTSTWILFQKPSQSVTVCADPICSHIVTERDLQNKSINN